MQQISTSCSFSVHLHKVKIQNLLQRSCLLFKQNAIESKITNIFNRNLLQMQRIKVFVRFFLKNKKFSKCIAVQHIAIQFYVIISSMEKKTWEPRTRFITLKQHDTPQSREEPW